MTAQPDHITAPAPPATVAELAVALVRLAAAQRAAFLDQLWTDEEAGAGDPLHRLVHPADTPQAEAAFRNGRADALGAERERIEQALAEAPPEPLARVLAVFRLSPAERACLCLTIAARADPGIAPLLAHVSPGQGVDYPTEALAARLFADGALAAWEPEGPAARWRLLRLIPVGPDRPPRIDLNDGLWRWIIDRPGMDPDLLGVVRPLPVPDPLPDWPVARIAGEIAKLTGTDGPGHARVIVTGPTGVGAKSFAGAVARDMGLRCFVVDLGRVAPEDRLEALIAVHRHAWLSGDVPVLVGAEHGPSLPMDMAGFPVVFERRGEPVTLGGRDGPELCVRLGLPRSDARAGLWRAHHPASAAWPKGELAALARTHALPPGEIARVAAHAPVSAAAATALLSARHDGIFGPLARRIDCPFTLDDLVLSDRLSKVIKTLLHEARARTSLWDRAEIRALFPGGRGLIALLAGPPGTGKTMAAQVLAAELGRDLFRVDAASLVSKYIGETMENIQRLFDRARETDAILLFDEADGFFARRTELSTSNDRHANQDTGQLLQAVEAHDGIVVLSSNRRRNIDEAFQRRLRYIIDFPAPDAGARAAIWSKVMAAFLGPREARVLAPVLARAAARVEMTGAQIKQAALTAHFAADRDGARLAPSHLVDGIDAELLKEGRALSPKVRAELEASE